MVSHCNFSQYFPHLPLFGSLFIIQYDSDLMHFFISEFPHFGSFFLADVGVDLYIEIFLFSRKFFNYMVSSFLVLRFQA